MTGDPDTTNWLALYAALVLLRSSGVFSSVTLRFQLVIGSSSLGTMWANCSAGGYSPRCGKAVTGRLRTG